MKQNIGIRNEIQRVHNLTRSAQNEINIDYDGEPRYQQSDSNRESLELSKQKEKVANGYFKKNKQMNDTIIWLCTPEANAQALNQSQTDVSKTFALTNPASQIRVYPASRQNHISLFQNS